jgi:hypothetical protein
MYAETGGETDQEPADLAALGFDIAGGDLDGKYFVDTDYDIEITSWTPSDLAFTVTCTGSQDNAPETPANGYVLDQAGNLEEGVGG